MAASSLMLTKLNNLRAKVKLEGWCRVVLTRAPEETKDQIGKPAKA